MEDAQSLQIHVILMVSSYCTLLILHLHFLLSVSLMLTSGNSASSCNEEMAEIEGGGGKSERSIALLLLLFCPRPAPLNARTLKV